MNGSISQRHISRMNKEEKRFLIIVLWTSIAAFIGVFFLVRRWWLRNQETGAPFQSARPSPVASITVRARREGFVLVTLNELLFEGSSLDLKVSSVLSFVKLASHAAESSDGLVVLVTIPDARQDDMERIRKLVENRLESSGLFQAGLKLHRIVFTSTVDGRISVGRQMQASVFIDPDERVVAELDGKVPSVVHIGPDSVKKIFEHFPGIQKQ